MSSIQFDYSTLSTSISQSELGSVIGRHMIDSNYDINEESSSEKSSNSEIYVQSPPPDRYKFVYFTFGLFGIATLLPWNFFITANDYWMYKLRDAANKTCIDNHNKTDLQASFTSYLSVSSNVPYVIFLVLCTMFNDKFSKMFRVVVSLFLMLILFSIMTAFININTDSWQYSFFILTMVLVVVMGVTSAILQASVSGIASLLPPKYMHIMVIGQAVAGIIAAVAQVISLLGHCDSIRSALIYFLFADIVILLALLTYIGIQSSEFFKYHVFNLKDATVLKGVSEPEPKMKTSVLLITKLLWPYAFSILLDLWVTIGIFPGLAVLMIPTSEGNTLNGKLFLPVCCFLLFNMSDFCGRVVGGWIPFPSSRRIHLLLLCIARVAFIPLFMLCNVQPRHNLPIIFSNDAYYIAFITLLGFTNGYLVSVAMMTGIKSVNPVLQEMAGVVLSAFLGGGLMLGAVSSYIFLIML